MGKVDITSVLRSGLLECGIVRLLVHGSSGEIGRGAVNGVLRWKMMWEEMTMPCVPGVG